MSKTSMERATQVETLTAANRALQGECQRLMAENRSLRQQVTQWQAQAQTADLDGTFLRCELAKADERLQAENRRLRREAANRRAEMPTTRELVMQAIGEASMCWNPRPEGVFDSERAIEVGERLLQGLQAVPSAVIYERLMWIRACSASRLDAGELKVIHEWADEALQNAQGGCCVTRTGEKAGEGDI